MRILISAEGPGDVGGLARPVYGEVADEGFFQPLIRRTVNAQVEFVGDRSLALSVKPPKTVSKKLSQRPHRAVGLADAQDCDVVVIHTDADAAAKGSKPPVRWSERRHLLEIGVQAAGADRPPAALAVPVATTEAWALGDAACIRARAVKKDAALKRSPELLWGAPHDPSSNHPKCLLARLLGSVAGAAAQAEIAEVIDLEEARRRCPRSLEPFLAQPEAAVA